MKTRIPEDVLFEILKRLPVKSLCRLRSVSTTWLSAISDPCFIRSHYALSETSSKLFLFRAQSGQPCEWLVYDQHQSKLVAAVKLPNSSTNSSPELVHGLICCLNSPPCVLTILNPTTRENKSISLPKITAISSPYRHYKYQYHCFGFDPVAGKHKILCSYKATDVQSRYSVSVIEHWVGSVDDQIWRMVGVNDSHWMCKLLGEVCIDGVIYFLAYFNSYTLVAFDLKSERFNKAKLSIPGARSVPWYKLIEFNGSLALVEIPLHYIGCQINVWVLEDFDEQVWDLKRWVFSPDWFFGATGTEVVSFACALRHGEILVFTPYRLEVRPSLDLFFCDTKSSRFWSRRIQVPVGDVFAECFYTSLICSDHVESLLGCLASPKSGHMYQEDKQKEAGVVSAG